MLSLKQCAAERCKITSNAGLIKRVVLFETSFSFLFSHCTASAAREEIPEVCSEETYTFTSPPAICLPFQWFPSAWEAHDQANRSWFDVDKWIKSPKRLTDESYGGYKHILLRFVINNCPVVIGE